MRVLNISLLALLLLGGVFVASAPVSAQTPEQIQECVDRTGSDNNQDYDNCVDGFGGSEGVGPSTSGSITPESACGKDNGRSFLGIPVWDRGVDCESITTSSITDVGDDNPLRLIILNITAAAAIIAGYIAVVFVVVGGFKYVLSDGSPDKAADARKTIINALIGAAIAALAAIVIEIIFNQITS